MHVATNGFLTPSSVSLKFKVVAYIQRIPLLYVVEFNAMKNKINKKYFSCLFNKEIAPFF